MSPKTISYINVTPENSPSGMIEDSWQYTYKGSDANFKDVSNRGMLGRKWTHKDFTGYIFRKPIVELSKGDLMEKDDTGKPKSILLEAEGIVNGDRQNDYGPPEENLERIVNYWNAYLKNENVPVALDKSDVCNLMILLKMARAQNKYTRDSYVDIAGYAQVNAWINEGKKDNKEKK